LARGALTSGALSAHRAANHSVSRYSNISIQPPPTMAAPPLRRRGGFFFASPLASAASALASALLLGGGAAGMPMLGVPPVGDEGVSLLARGYRLTPHAASPKRGAPACAALKDHGSHFTVDIEVGTPGQKFSVVADTGSNSLIITSCICTKQGICDAQNRCFTGTNRSSTFQLYTTEDTHNAVEEVVTFGSGQIKGVIAKDNVSVGGKEVFMADGLLLMVDQALDLSGPFEGILGLGLPLKDQPEPELREADTPAPSPFAANPFAANPFEWGGAGQTDGMQSGDLEDIINRIFGGAGTLDIGGIIGDTSDQGPTHMMGKRLSPKAMAAELKRQMNLRARRQAMAASARSSVPQVKSFLEQAKIDRFSVCFNDGEDGGVLRLGLPEMPTPLRSVGRDHWGLDFRGISVGDSEPTRLKICSKDEMTEGQETPCGAIPDSGTTFMMGPQEHLDELYKTLCDSWERCASNHSALVKAAKAANKAASDIYGTDPFEVKAASKAKVLQFLVGDCKSWLGDKGLSEMPALNFHVADAGEDKEHLLQMSGVDYVVQSRGNSSDEYFCQLAFGPMAYPTQKNGPVWIMGLPTFYAYTVTYDTQAEPPTMAFVSTSDTPCGSCAPEVGLLTSEAATHAKKAKVGSAATHRQARRLDGPPRLPTLDRSRPL